MIDLLVVLQVEILKLSSRIESYLLVDFCHLLLQVQPSFQRGLRIIHIDIFILLQLATLRRGITLTRL